MQHATCNMRLCRQRCELNERCGDGVVGSGRARHPPPHPAFAWRGGMATAVYPVPRYRLGSKGKLVAAKESCASRLHAHALHPRLHMRPHLRLYSWSVSQGGAGAGSLGCGQAGEKVPPARFGSVRVGRMWACSSKLAVQERASPWLYKSSPRVARVYHAAFSSGLPSLFHSSLLVPLPKPYLSEDWFGPDSIVLFPSLCA